MRNMIEYLIWLELAILFECLVNNIACVYYLLKTFVTYIASLGSVWQTMTKNFQ